MSPAVRYEYQVNKDVNQRWQDLTGFTKIKIHFDFNRLLSRPNWEESIPLYILLLMVSLFSALLIEGVAWLG
jgi:hypothetical protein